MKIYKESQFKGGWFVGNFQPSISQIEHCEVAVKRYKKEDSEAKHYHKLADEITVVVEGVIQMNDMIFKKGDIILIEKNEAVMFRCLEDAITVVVKIPSVVGDKYVVNE